MAFITDKHQVKSGVIIFRRTDVEHRNWYCRVKLPKVDRYKTVSLKTADRETAIDLAVEQDSDVRYAIKHNVPVFNRPFSDIGKEYIDEQERRAKGGEISLGRVRRVRSVVEGKLQEYVGTTQVQMIGLERWEGYPGWRRANGEGRMARPGFTRPRTDEEVAQSEKAAAAAEAARKKAVRDKTDTRKHPVANARAKKKSEDWIIVSDATIRMEMSIFVAVMRYAADKRYVALDRRFGIQPNLKKVRRDEFTLEEYRRLHSMARGWVNQAANETSKWYRDVAYNFMLIMCNTGMRPSEARNLRWRDVTHAKDRDGRDIVVLFVSGKGKSRKLIAPVAQNAGEYIERIKKLSVANEPDDPVFTTSNGKSTPSLYHNLIQEMLKHARLRNGPSGIPRSTYCFRHTYATLRLSEGVDVYFLAEQMGTSVKMIEEHYGHVNTVKHADRVLHGMGNWEPPAPKKPDDATKKTKRKQRSRKATTEPNKQKASDAKAARAAALRQNNSSFKKHS
jgi:integrase